MHQENNDETIEQLLKYEKLSKLTNSKLRTGHNFFFANKANNATCSHMRRRHRIGREEHSRSAADLILSEMALLENPITENIITIPTIADLKSLSEVESNRSNNKGSTQTNLLQQNDRQYFNEDEMPIFNTSLQPKPLSQFMLRNDLLEVVYSPPKFVRGLDLTQKLGKGNDNLLDIQLKSFKFVHHHLHSLEHTLSQILIDTYKEYDNRASSKSLDSINYDLTMKRKARDKIMSEMYKLKKTKTEIYSEVTVVKYIQYIEQLRQKFYNESKESETLKNNIKMLWKDIKKIRLESSSVKSSVKIETFKVDLDEAERIKIWNDMYDNEYNDEIHLMEYMINKEKLHKYKLRNIDINEQKETQSECYKSTYVDENNLRQVIQNKLHVIGPKNYRMDIKLQFDETSLTDEPYEMSLYRYSFKISVDDNFVCETDKFKINNNFYVELSESFSVQILPKNKYLEIELVENNATISKQKLVLSTLMTDASKYVCFFTNLVKEPSMFNVGSGYTLLDIAKKMKIKLKSNEIVKNKLYTTGKLRLMVEFNNSFSGLKSMTFKNYIDVCNILTKLENAVEFDFNVLGDVISKVTNTEDEASKLINTAERLRLVLEGKPLRRINSYFKFVTDDKELNLENPRFRLLRMRETQKIFKNMIVPMYSSEITTEQLQLLYGEKDLFNHYIHSDGSNHNVERIDFERYLGAKYIKNVNECIQQNLLDSLHETSYEDIVNEDYTRDQSCGGMQRLRLLNRLKPKAGCDALHCRLLQSRIVGKIENVHKPLIRSPNIRVTILRAFCLHERKSLDNSNHKQDEGFTLKQLRPFVRVSCCNITERTSTAVGNDPSWNQVIDLDVRTNVVNAININIYDEIKDDLSLEYEHDASENRIHYRLSQKWLGTLQIPGIALQLCSKMQGAIKINSPPVILGYRDLAKSGSNNARNEVYDPIVSMQKNEPFILLSLDLNPPTQLSTNRNIAQMNIHNANYMFRHLADLLQNYLKEFPDRLILLTYFATNGTQKCVTQFLQAISLPDLELIQRELRITTRKESATSKSSSSRSGEIKKENSDRVDSATTRSRIDSEMADRDSTGNTFEMKTLGNDNSNLETIIQFCVRYVSLIPIYEPTQPYEVTLMGSELLKMMHGSSRDHTILLTSYLLYLGVKCWVVSGIGMPRGYSSYVMILYDTNENRILLTTDTGIKYGTFNTSKYNNIAALIFDAANGTKYDIKDSCSPLKTIHYVYNDENIWINLQAIDSCNSVRLDFSRPSDWYPVFSGNTNLSKLPSLQEQGLYTAPVDVGSLRDKIENKIKVKVQKWRAHRRTIWNRYCSSVLKETLPNWEYWSFNIHESKPGPNNRLKQLMSTYKIYGFPLNLAYTNMKQILSSIKSTALFLNEEPGVEFGLAVEVYSYPAAVLSVWIYMASINRV